MNGIQFLTDDKGRRTAAVIDLKSMMTQAFVRLLPAVSNPNRSAIPRRKAAG